MTANFTDVLNAPVSKVERPPIPPFGTYIVAYTKMPEQRDFQGKDGRSWLSMDFNLRLFSPREDVDTDMLAEYEAKAGSIAKARPVRLSFIAENTDEGKAQLRWNLREFSLKKLGLDPGPDDNSKTIGQLLSEGLNHQFLATMKWGTFTEKASGEPVQQMEVQSTTKL